MTGLAGPGSVEAARPARASRLAATTQPAATKPAASPAPRETPEQHAAALARDKAFSHEAMRQFRLQLALVETAHFLIWTTLGPEYQRTLASECEAMYGVLQQLFQTPANEPVFLGKCSVFVLASPEQFQVLCRLAHELPPDRAQRATGLHVAFPDGRTHILVYWPGNLSQLSNVLVHEGAHAFLFRCRSTSHVVTWFNDGLAEHVVALVFRGQSAEGREAIQKTVTLMQLDPQLLLKLLAGTESLPLEYYPAAQSMVAFLVQADGQAFVKLVHALKDGVDFERALKQTYNATLPQLDAHWRQWVNQVSQSGRSLY